MLGDDAAIFTPLILLMYAFADEARVPRAILKLKAYHDAIAHRGKPRLMIVSDQSRRLANDAQNEIEPR